jgi:hypothetical protein
MQQGGGVFEVFRFFDADESNSIDYSEFKDVVKKLGVKVEDGQLKTLFRKYDLNKNNALSFGEFSKMVEHAEEHGAISDENHWAYPLIENFRRRAAKSKKSLTQIFRAEFRPGESACFISWENFYEVFEENQYISPEAKKRLKSLLDVKGNQGRVDLLAFQCLVGIAMKPADGKGVKKKKHSGDDEGGGNW